MNGVAVKSACRFCRLELCGAKQDRHSVSGRAVQYAGGVVVRLSTMQHRVTLRTTEIDYDVLPRLPRRYSLEANSRRQLALSCDAGAIKLANNTIYTNRPKHIDFPYYFVQRRGHRWN